MRTRTSGSREAGPIVATILVRRVICAQSTRLPLRSAGRWVCRHLPIHPQALDTLEDVAAGGFLARAHRIADLLVGEVCDEAVGDGEPLLLRQLADLLPQRVVARLARGCG